MLSAWMLCSLFAAEDNSLVWAQTKFKDTELALVTLKTNITTTVSTVDNAKGCQYCDMLRGGSIVPSFYHPPHGVTDPYSPATEKWETTITNQVVTIYCMLPDGRKIKDETKTEIGKKIRHWVLTQQWNEVEPITAYTNATIYNLTNWAVCATNYIMTNLYTLEATNIWK